MPAAVQDVYNQLGSLYDPQTQLLQGQISQADLDAQAQQAALDQAKVNAFRDIETSSNRRGMLFSGFSPDQQAQYVGTKYLPAVANLKSTVINTKNSLLSKIQQLNAERQNTAERTVAEQAKAEQDQAYKEAQLGLGYARLQASQSRAGGFTPYQQYQMGKDAANQFKVSQKKGGGGYQFVGPQGRPISLGQYVGGIGGDINTVLDLLRNGSSYDKKIYNNVNIMLKNRKIGSDPGAIAQAIAQQDYGNYYGLR